MPWSDLTKRVPFCYNSTMKININLQLVTPPDDAYRVCVDDDSIDVEGLCYTVRADCQFDGVPPEMLVEDPFELKELKRELEYRVERHFNEREKDRVVNGLVDEILARKLESGEISYARKY